MLGNLALAFNALGQRDEAFRRAEEALSVFQAIDSPLADRVWEMLAGWRGQT